MNLGTKKVECRSVAKPRSRGDEPACFALIFTIDIKTPLTRG